MPEPSSTPASAGFSGRRRQRTTRGSVKLADRVARLLITVGGTGTVLAVLGVCFYLVWVVLPLFLPARLQPVAAFPHRWGGVLPLHVSVDEQRVAAWALLPDGNVEAFTLAAGEALERVPTAAEGVGLTAVSVPPEGDSIVLGFSDGTLRTGRIGFVPAFADPATVEAELAAALHAVPVGTPVPWERGVAQLTPEGQVRTQTLDVDLTPPVSASLLPILSVGHVAGLGESLIAVVAGDAERVELLAMRGSEKEDFLTGGKVWDWEAPRPLPLRALGEGAPAAVIVDGSGREVTLVWETGELLRLADVSGPNPFVVEEGRLIESTGSITAVGSVIGQTTLVWGDDQGRVQGGFTVRLEDLEGQGLYEGWRDPARAASGLALVKEFPRGRGVLLTVAPSARSRLVACGFTGGEVRVYNATTGRDIAAAELPDGEDVLRVVLAPKEDALIAVTARQVHTFDLDRGYPEAGFAALFRPVAYEGYGSAAHMWQSTGGSDSFEPKLGLMPLIFGTVKATFYTLLFGVPVALLAAIYTSEFLQPRVRAVVKPSIELMASLPSVVLGFLGALVLAPFVERVLPALLAGFIALPIAFIVVAYLWQLLPPPVSRRLEPWRFPFLLVVVPLGLGAGILAAPALERLLFAGNLRGWLAWDPATGSPWDPFAASRGGWMILLLPFCCLGVWFLAGRYVNPILRAASPGWSRNRAAVVDFARFIAALLASALLAVACGILLEGAGFDPRGLVVGGYVQRNSLVVGFVMGFAIIPIIYTLAEDALTTVPRHLRSASLGTGATPWQTTVRIVVPTAMSGLFSAMMIGLGRAVGETMIVLMAAGNTPIMDWNVFEGFRTLSANIAVELPEAVRNSTHYRTLFLAALVLFAMTFVVNTVAEIVRLRFRRRAYQL